MTTLAACELQDVCHDAITMGAAFAEDPSIQAAVLAKLKSSPDLQAVMMNYGVTKECLDATEVRNQVKELQSEVEFQQEINQDMITHAERLAEERMELKARVVSLERENDRLRTALEQVQPEVPRVVIDNVALPSEPLQQPRRQRSRGARQEARAAGAEQRASASRPEGPTGAAIVVQMAIAFAAVVVALVVAKKLPPGIRASAFLGAVFNAFGTYRR